MHQSILAKRQLDAQARSMAAASTLAQRYGLTLPDARQVRDPAIAQLFKWEALATFLEALAAAEPAPGLTLADVLAVEGLSKTAVKAIAKAFGEDSTDDEE